MHASSRKQAATAAAVTCRKGNRPVMKPREDWPSARSTAGSPSRLPRKSTPTRLATPSAMAPRRCPSDAALKAQRRSSAASFPGGGGVLCAHAASFC